MQRSKELLTAAVLACSASVYYVSAIFLSEIISFKSTILTLLYVIATGFIYLFAMISKDSKTVLLKWLISIFSGAGVWWCFIRCDYSIRAINWAIPGYGPHFSAGGNFAGTCKLLTLSFLCFGGIIISLIIKPKHYERFRKVQIPVSIAFTVLIIAVAIILERQFPSADLIYS